MKVVYLLVENKTSEVVGIYKYQNIALLAKERGKGGIQNAVGKMFKGKENTDYRVEVQDLIE